MPEWAVLWKKRPVIEEMADPDESKEKKVETENKDENVKENAI